MLPLFIPSKLIGFISTLTRTNLFLPSSSSSIYAMKELVAVHCLTQLCILVAYKLVIIIIIVNNTTNNNMIKHLDLCTETLGCESGEIFGAFEDSREEIKFSIMKKRKSIPTKFPPPLKTLGLFQLGRKRVEERLMLVPLKPSTGVLTAERSEGRLRLRLLPSSHCTVCIPGGDENGDEIVEEENLTGKYKRTSRCKEEKVWSRMGKMIMLNADALWVASS